MACLTPICEDITGKRTIDGPSGSDLHIARLEILALAQSLNAEILGSPSASLHLEK